MSGIDRKALNAACKEFKEHLYIPGKTSKDERVAIKAAIEAYLAAKPSPWSPIGDKDTPRNGKPILVWTPRFDGPFGECDDRTEILRFERSRAGPEVYWYAYSGRALTDQGLIDIKARWRNIDPPTQDSDCYTTGPTKNERG